MQAIILTLGIALLACDHVKGSPFVTCKRTFKKMGCFQEKNTKMDLIINDRDVTSSQHQGHVLNWQKFADSIHSLACRCAAKAKELDYKYFSIRFWGECYAGKDTLGLENVLKDPTQRSNQCVDHLFKECLDSTENECVGKAYAEYLYTLTASSQTALNGGYSEWSDFSECSATCGAGVSARERTCTKPAPLGDGLDCTDLGPSTETRSCLVQECTAGWVYVTTGGQWCNHPRVEKHVSPRNVEECKNWCRSNNRKFCMWDYGTSDGFCMASNECTSTLMAGDRRRYNVWKWQSGDGGYSEWSEFGVCSASCGFGVSSRKRSCSNPAPLAGGLDCSRLGPSEEIRSCKVQECAVDGQWTPWSPYSSCSVSCGGGTQSRSRSCTNPAPAFGGKTCPGTSTETTTCNRNDCPAQWVSYPTGGQWCNHARLERHVSAGNVQQCLSWCRSNNRLFCMWDSGTSDGFCMASNECSSRLMAGDRRRYSVWRWQ